MFGAAMLYCMLLLKCLWYFNDFCDGAHASLVYKLLT
jgi:hypothetical protein